MLTDLFHRLRALFRRTAVERELDDELQFHVDRQKQKYRQAGVRPDEIERRVRLEFGGMDQIKEQCRDARGVSAVDELVRNLRYACRTLARRPGFALVAIVTLALAIGANSAVFSAINTILLRPLSFPDADRLVLVQQYEPKTATPPTFVAPARLDDWRRMNGTFQSLTGYYSDDMSETSGELPERIECAWVAPSFFQAWEVPPALGRMFAPEEERFGGPPAVVISDRLWKRRFASDPNVIGRPLRVGRQSFSIVGVMPASFRFPLTAVDVWSSSPLDAPYARNRQSTWFTVIGRLKPGVTVTDAQADLDRVQARLGKQYPATDATLAARVRPLKDVTIGGIGGSLWMLFAAVSLLLLIACTNIAALLLARTADRRREIAIRYSLGASRASIVRQLLSEAVMLAVCGALLGLFVAAAGFRTFRMLAGGLPRVAELKLDWTLVVYSLTCGVGTTLLFGLLPAARNTRRDLGDSLAQGGRALTPSTHRLQWLLVGVQIALAVTLLFGAGLLLRSFQALVHVSPGFDPTRVLTFRITGNWAETADINALSRRIEGTLESLRALPGVEAAATSLAVPGAPFQFQTELRVLEGGTNPTDRIMASNRIVSAGYFTTMRIPVLAGDACGEHADVATAVVNRKFAALYLSRTTPVGSHVEQVPRNSFLGAARILGVVGDAREQGLNQEPPPIVYWCNAAPVPAPLFLVRTRTDPMGMAETIRRKIQEIEPRRSVYELMPLDQHLDDTFSENRLRTVLLAAFAGTAISLAAVGLYGTLGYFVTLRRREIGVRIAMGALRREIASSFLRQGLRVALAGCAAGIWLAAALGRALSGMLYGVSALDVPTFAGVLLMVLGIAGAASLWPAIRAARIEPIQVLRDD
ncbi:MAG TPA: ABC transporter permease [Vicinamibacterales bacterium]|nr:ABC transporter permease [Vicinamibacterales bacterium]